MENLVIGETFDSTRLDIVLSNHREVSSRAEAQRIIKNGTVKINDSTERINPKRMVRTGDVITFSVLPPPQSNLIPVPFDLDIVFEDQHLIIVNKPHGVVVHPSAGHHCDTLVNYLLHHTGLSTINPSRPGIVHRIDKDTSGLLIVAKDNKTHENLAKQFFHHQTTREYEAIIWGVPESNSGKINQPVGRHPVNRKKFAVRENGKNAITHWRVLRNYKYLCLVECKLETGRTHQIRIHMNSIGHPLLGDPLYGKYRNYDGKLPKESIAFLKGFSRQALHAKSLGFTHPISGKVMRFETPLPADMQYTISNLEQIYN